MTQVTEPFPIFYDDDGTPLENGLIYIGQVNQDPRANPVVVYTDFARTIPIAQPIRTLNGRPAFQGAPINLYIAEAEYSIAIQNRFGTPIVSAPDGSAFVTSRELAASGGSDLVGFIQSGTGAVARTVQDKLRESVSVKDFGAVGDGVTDDTAAIQAALGVVAAYDNGGTVVLPIGTYNCGSTKITVPQKVTLHLDGAEILSSAANAIEITLGSDSLSGKISGSGHAAKLTHTGTGYGIVCNGAGESRANVFISDILIEGSSSGTAGLYTTAFNRLTTSNLKINGYTAGAAHLNEGANAITHFSPSFESCLHGMDNVSVVKNLVQYSANAIMMFGGHIFGCTGWGWRERKSTGSDPNIGNLISGCTFENNGVNASSTTGHVFIQFAVGIDIQGSYFEDYVGTVPVTAILIGDASNAPQSINIVGNLFATTGTNVIENNNGQSVWVENNHVTGAATNFVNQGANGRLLRVKNNRAPAVSAYFTGSDGGSDSIIDLATNTFVNSHSDTIRGYGFNAISGLAQDLVIRTRASGTNCVTFQAIDGTGIGSLTNAGAFNVSTSYSVAGTKVVGAQGAAVADASGGATIDAEARAAINTLLARLRVHGLIAT